MNLRNTLSASISLLVVLGMTSTYTFANDEALGYQAQNNSVLTINTDRDALVRTLASQWANPLEEEENTLLQSFNALENTKLITLNEATSLQQVKDILTPTSRKQDATDTAKLLGDVAKNLVYTPVTPCRILDTRNAGTGSPLAAGSSKNYYVHGSAGKISAQGGNATGCSAPNGEPSAVHANFTIVSTGTSGTTKGNIRVYPKDYPEPTSSLVNYKLGTVFTNAATIRTCTNCGQDITIKAQFNATRVIVDVLGYYYPEENPHGKALAFGYFSAAGIKKSGTSNISATWNALAKRYDITISGETYFFNKYSTFITPSSSTCPDVTSSVTSLGGKLLAFFTDVQGTGSGDKKQCNFQIAIFKK
jgi:hypothetical protein